MRQQLQQPINEQQCFIDPVLQRQLTKSCQASLNAINIDLKNADKQIQALIQADDYLRTLFDLVTSVSGVGKVTATEVLIAIAGRPREEFKTIRDAKKLACHADVAPFEYRSGSSVRSKTRVNEHARKRLKSLFHLGAMSAIGSKASCKIITSAKLAKRFPAGTKTRCLFSTRFATTGPPGG